MENDSTAKTCSMHSTVYKYIHISGRKHLKIRDHLEKAGIREMIILKWISEEYV
jgi:hypothetical protein